jgi:hypothetical protein
MVNSPNSRKVSSQLTGTSQRDDQNKVRVKMDEIGKGKVWMEDTYGLCASEYRGWKTS